MFLGKQFKYLKENEIAGADTINPIVDYLRGIRSLSNFIVLNPNGNKSMSIDLDIESLKDALDVTVNENELLHTFKATVNGNNYSISGGTVYFGREAYSVSGRASTSAETSWYVQIPKTGSITWNQGTVSNLLNASNQTVNLPILQAYKQSGDWKFRYYHIGNWAFQELPYFWLSNFDKTKQQFLSHNANSDELYWQDITDCEE